MSRVKILFLAASPASNPLMLDEEIRAITAKIRASEHRDLLDLVSAWAVRADDLLQYLNEHRPQIVHFSGHGSTEGEIILIDDSGAPKPVDKTALGALFQTLRDNIRVVILNACHSSIQAEAITKVIDCEIGMNASIGDSAATTFAASFYRAIGFGRSVQEAFEQGKVALMLEGFAEEAVPELLCRPGVDPSKVILLGASTPLVPTSQSMPHLSEKKDLEIVDIAFHDELQSGGQIVLDIKLRNASTQVAFIKSAEIMVREIWLLAPVFDTGALILPSANYDLEIPIKEPPYSVASPVSQAILPDDVDRFTLTLSCEPHLVLLAQLALTYDADNKKLSSGNLVFAKHGSSCRYPTMTAEELAQRDEEVSRLNETWETEWWRERRKYVIHNNSVRKQISSIVGVRNETIQDLEAI